VNGRASTRLQLVATFAFAALLTAVLAAGSALLRPGPGCVPLLIWSSQEKFGMLNDFAAQYSRTARLVDGRCVSVAVKQVNSGDAEQALETMSQKQTDRPDVWSPASSAWVSLLTYKLRGGGGVLPPPSNYQSLFQSPLVVGMPEPMAVALGYPKNRIGWGKILSLAQDPRGWGSYGKSQLGKFQLGKTNPTVSTSGLHALIGTYFAATSGTLNVERMSDPAVKRFVKGVESSVVHYGETASDFLKNLLHADEQGLALSYISAIAVEEKELIDYNKGVIRGVVLSVPNVKLVPIYPAEGTPFADHPYVILAWSANKARAAQSFYDYLQEPESQKTVDANGFRNRIGKPGDAVKAAIKEPNQPTVSILTQTLDGAVLDTMLTDWKLIRKPARVLIVVDVAANSGALQQATALLAGAVRLFQAQDSVGVWTFPAPAATHTELRPVSQVTDDLETTLKAIAPFNGLSNVGPVIEAAIDEMGRSYDSAKVDAVLLVEMSPGDSLAADIKLKTHLASQSPTKFVRLFTIGPAGNARLADLVLWGQGIAYDRTATHLLTDVISNF
jgi:Ca-activated chloride channel family protein